MIIYTLDHTSTQKNHLVCKPYLAVVFDTAQKTIHTVEKQREKIGREKIKNKVRRK